MVGERQLCVCGGRDEFVCVSVCVEMGVCVVGEKGNMYRECWRDKWGLWKERCVYVCVFVCVCM